MLRYATEDDFGLPETAFNVCTFWLIEALWLTGRSDDARALFEEMLSRRTACRIVVRGYRSGDRRAVGQLPADLFAGRPDQLRRAAEQAVEFGPMSRLIIVSNRVSPPTGGGGGNQGGLAVALSAALRESSGIWFGWSGETTERVHRPYQPQRNDGVTTATIDLEDQDVDEYYNGYANRTLWPLFHYRIDLAEYRARLRRRL
jgi:hypothetical protein